MECGRVLVVCSRCGGILWGGRIRRASSLASVCGASSWFLPELRFVMRAWAVVVERNYADVRGDAPPLYLGRSSKATNGEAANRRNNQASPGAGIGSETGAGARCGAEITRMTAVRITAAATTGRNVMASPAISQPRNKATTGFTNANVTTR